jgi:hypothetical protein
MKTPRWFIGSRFVSHLRMAGAVTLMSAAAAMAFVAVKPSGPLWANADNKNSINKFRQDRVAFLRNKLALPGAEREGGPTAAAEQAYANRAYPAAYVPFPATVRARTAFQKVRARATASIGAWNLIGPSTTNFPDVLTFSGAPYVTSGRITALAISPSCSVSNCRVWAAAAGGGVWRTDNALSTSGPSWTFISGSFATNAIGTLTYDTANNVLYAGTGEPNSSGDSEAGFGVYKSNDGGNSWTHLASNTTVPAGSGVDCDAVFGVPPGTFGVQSAPAYSGPAFDGRSISSIVIDPGNASVIYVSSDRGVRGISSVTGGTASLAPGLPPYGLWKSTDGGANFTLLNYQDVCLNPTLPGSAGIIQASFGSSRGVHETALDPNSSSVVYAGPYPQNNAIPLNTKGGVWRSTDSGTTWTQIKTALTPSLNTDRASFAVTPITSGFTRMYVGDGSSSVATANQARLYRTDDAAGAASFTDLTAVQTPANQTLNYCGDPAVGAQCWYDNVVYSPPGKPDVVYLGGSFNYSQYGFRNNGRAFIRSSDAGMHFTDMSWDATTNPTPPGSCCQPNAIAPNGMHPDSHAIVEVPGTDAAIFGSDGGLVRSSGVFTDISAQCSTRPLSPTSLATCQQLLSAVPSFLYNLNAGLSTIQFQSVSYNPLDPNHDLLGGNQDNGTLRYSGSTTWNQAIYGDGGQSGFNVSNPALMFNSFSSNFHDVNFQNGNPTKWVIASGPIAATEPGGAQFYAPIIADPLNAGTIFEGSLSVWRTQDWAGNQAVLEANCPEFTTAGNNPACGDFVRIGPAGATNLTASAGDYRGTTLAGGNVAAFARTRANGGTLWVATTTGRVFISSNADAAAGSVTFTRLDTLPGATAAPGRFVSSIYIDQSNPNHAWMSYSGYSTLTPSTPGHVFSVTYNPRTHDATWVNLDGGTGGPMGDLPVTALVRSSRGDLFAGTDFGVMRLANGSSTWTVAGTGLPAVEVAGLTLVNGSHVLYAATHGRSVWSLQIP